MIEQVERVFRLILTLEILLIVLLIFLLLSGFASPPHPSVAINPTTPPTINVTATATPAPTPTPTGWYYDPESGHYVKSPA